MKFVFFGTPEFATIILEKLIASGYTPSVVVCSPDEPVGRNKIITSPPVKRLIVNSKWPIEIFQPATKAELLAISHKLSSIQPDLAIIAAYGKILPKEILDIPCFGFINIHPSLLPKYRGPSPIQAAILNGDEETGVTIMKVDEEMDHGKIISNLPPAPRFAGRAGKTQISKLDTYESLSQKLAVLGASLLIKIIPGYISGEIKPVEQDHDKATYTKIIKKENGKIDWNKSAAKIERMTRAYYPWPTAWTHIKLKIQNSKIKTTSQNSKLLKILEAEILNEDDHKIGEVFLTKNNLIAVKCGEKSLIIKKLQLEGGKVLTAKEFLNGHRGFIGSVLNN